MPEQVAARLRERAKVAPGDDDRDQRLSCHRQHEVTASGANQCGVPVAETRGRQGVRRIGTRRNCSSNFAVQRTTITNRRYHTVSRSVRVGPTPTQPATIVAKLGHRFQEAPRLAALRKASGGLASPRLVSTEFRVQFLVGDSAILVRASGGTRTLMRPREKLQLLATLQ